MQYSRLTNSPPVMELKEILAQNLRDLMKKHRESLGTQIKIRERSKEYTLDEKGLAQATIQRILAREVHTGLDVLHVLAKVFEVEPAALISQNMTVAPSILDDSQNQASSTHSENALTLADLYEGLPKDRSLRLQKYRAATEALLRPQRPSSDQPNAKPAASVKARTQRA